MKVLVPVWHERGYELLDAAWRQLRIDPPIIALWTDGYSEPWLCKYSCQHWSEEHGIDVEFVEKYSYRYDAILDVAANRKVDVIYLPGQSASAGQGGGKLARFVLDHARCAVCIDRPEWVVDYEKWLDETG